MLNEATPHWKQTAQDRLVADLVCDLTYTLRLRPDGVFVREWASRDDFLGHAVDQLNDSQAWLALVHSDDRAAAQEALLKLRDNRDVVTELRLLSKSGELRWVRVYLRPELNSLGLVEYVYGALQDITPIKRSEAEKSALLQIARDIAATTELGTMLDRVQHHIAHVLPCDTVITFRWNEAQQAFCAVSSTGVPADLGDDLERLRMPRGTFGGQTFEGHAVVINDIEDQAWLSPELCTRFRIQSLIAVPLRVHGRHFGTVAAYNSKPAYRFDAAQVDLCEAIVQQLAIALERAELHEAQQEHATISGALAHVAQELIASLDQPHSTDRFCELVAKVLECDVAQTWIWHPAEQVYVAAAMHGYTQEEREQVRTLRLPRPLLEQWLTGGKSEDDVSQVVLEEHPSAAIRTGALSLGVNVLMHMRLHIGAELIGIQGAGYRARATPFSPVQMKIARGIAQIASMALSHARLMEELARVNRLKSDFVATMSHELRTPMNTLMGYTDLLAAGEFGPVTEEQRGVLSRMDQSARELLDLINATLDLSRIEARRVSIEVHDIVIPELLRELEVETRYQRQQRHLDFVWEITPESTRLRSDRVKLKVILKNLITNALKFTERGGVRINAVWRDAGIEVSVYDTGIGIAPEILPIIFEPFRQGESAATRRYGGVGLGLYVVRRLLDLLNGSISVESELGRGSTFCVWVPSETN